MNSNTKITFFSKAIIEAGNNMFKIVNRSMISFIMLVFLLFVSGAVFATKDGGVEDKPVVTTLTDASTTGAIPWATGVAINEFEDGSEYLAKINNVITFKIHEETTTYIPADFTAAVHVKIEYGENDNALQTIYKLFSINYKRGDAVKKYNAQNYYVLPDAKYVRVTILPADDAEHPGTQMGEANGVDPKKFVLLENKLMATRYYHLASNVEPVGFPTPGVGTIPSTDDHVNISWSWPENSGYNYTQLEWAWLENEMEAYYHTGGVLDENKLFAGNSTRLDLPHNILDYDIPVLYDGVGKLYVRVRAVNIAPESRADGPWSDSKIYNFIGHEEKLNWQASTSYAEDGKRKTVIQYFDGSLRNRQTVTKDNVTENVVTAETFYDGQGRAAMQILPAPGLENVIKYRADLNRFNGQTSVSQNPAEIFDLEPAAPGLQLTLDNTLPNSTSNYYSSLNPESNIGINKNIPDAEGYPYTLTRFTPDGTGRVMAQSGVGPNHKIGSGKETKYYYGVPAQEELDALFGTEVGTYTHYSKNLVKDANDQMSVSYVDMHGRTVATALAGNSPDNVTALNLDAVNYPNQNLAAAGGQVNMHLLDNTTNIIKNNSTIESVNSILVSAPNPYSFTYKLSPETLTQANCVGGTPASLCYECLYDLEIAITDESGETSPRIRRYANINLSTGITDNCTGTTSAFTVASGANNLALSGDISNGNTINFTEPLLAGSYSVRKTLTISESSLEAYKALYMSKQVCKTEEEYIQETFDQLSASTNCIAGTPNACASCNDVLGAIYVDSRFDEFRDKYLADIGLTATTTPILNEIRASFDANKATCNLVCNTSSQSLPTIREQMMADMKPYTGQYALSNVNPAASIEADLGTSPDLTSTMYKKYNIFAVESPAIDHQPFFRNPVTFPYDDVTKNPDNYYNSQGNVDETIYPQGQADKSFLNGINEADFAQQFNDSWLKTLLPHHPEYKRLLYAEEQLSPSYDWINNFKQASYATATDPAKDYIHPLVSDPFFIAVPAKLSAITASVNAYPGTIGIYPGSASTRSLTMWQIAYGDAVGCKTTQLEADRQNCYINSPTTAAPNPALTTTQNAQAWEIFKGLYAAERERLVSEHIAEEVPLNDDEYLVDQHYHLWFPKNSQQIADQNGWASWWPNNPGEGPKAPITEPTGLPLTPQEQYESTCTSYIDNWKAKLLQCAALNARTDKNAILTTITDRMKLVCINGSDQANPYGASNINPALVGTVADNSFEDVIRNVFTSNGIIVNGVFTDDYCNPFVIDWPKPYSKGPKLFGGEQAVVIDDCGCSQFSKLKSEALAASYDPTSFGSLNTYLNLTYNQVLTTTMFTALLKCRDELPCQKCDEFSQVVVDYNDTYPNGGVTTCATLTDTLLLDSRDNTLPVMYEARLSIEFLPGFESVTNDNFETFLTDTSICDPVVNCRQNFAAFFNNYYNNTTPLTWAQIESQYIANCGASPSICGSKDYSCNALLRLECQFINASSSSPSLSPIGGNFASNPDPQASFVDYFNNYYHNNPSLIWEDINTLYMNEGCDTSLLDHISLEVPFTCPPCALEDQYIVLQDPEPMPDFLKCGFVANNKCLSCGALSAYTGEYKAIFGNAPAGVAPVYGDIVLTDDQVAYNENFARFINYRTGYQYSWTEYAQKAGAANCALSDYAINTNATQDVICANPLALNDPQNLPQPTDPCEDILAKATAIGQEKYRLQQLYLLKDMEAAYTAKCLAAKDIEEFTVAWQNKEYHYTLYYYDMANNLLKTVAPKGVRPIYNNATNSGLVSSGTQETGSTMSGDAFHALVKASRNSDYNMPYTPLHQFTTNYRYNSLNQVVVQNTPDAATSKFWYDNLGRLVISQNAKQATTNRYSYTMYDQLGRIKEVGQKPNATAMSQTLSQNDIDLKGWIYNGIFDKEQITRTTYDVLCQTVNPVPIDQQNLRSRVSFSQYFDTDPDEFVVAGEPDLDHHSSATYYSYDVHGNVDVLVQDYKAGIMNTTSNRFKKMSYDYDLISGKVNEVAYQPQQADAFYHRYSYDAENRIKFVETSKDRILWEKDAHYSYYKHGPLARTVLGQLQVQGMDYAYTLQGWLKGVNSTSLNPLQDIGGDGVPDNSVVAKDVLGFAQHYYDDANDAFDYKAINTTVKRFARPSTNIGFSGKSLFNGNIAGITMNNGGLANGAAGTTNASPLFYKYGYDQLNRLVNMQAYTGLNTTDNTWPASPTTTDDYKEQVSYDPNGNIVSYHRNGATGITPPSGFTGGQAMDQLSYKYYYYDNGNNKLPYNPTTGVPAGGRGTNQLASVADEVSATNYADDIDDQANTDNYVYDEIGNLVIDKAEGLYNPTTGNPAGTAIEWNVYGKIAKITKLKAGTTTVINYKYDVSGNRISKQVTQSGAITSDKTTVYVRDASGNTMSIYEAGDLALNNGNLTQTEVHLYGSSRLGLMNTNVNVQNPTANTTGITIFERANKVFELSNHLGNVLATVSDRTFQFRSDLDLAKVGYYLADVITANDYYPFGMQMPGRNYSQPNTTYRYGFNGKEKADEISTGHYAFEARIYDSRLGRLLSHDPREADYPWQSTYAYYRNSPISTVDFLGMGDYYDKDGKHLGSDGKTKTITVGKGKKATTKEVADDKAYIATSVKLNDKGLVGSAENSAELRVSNSVLNQLANTTAEESSGNMYESFGIASAIVNLSYYKGKDISTTLRTEGIYGYGNGGNSTKYKGNAEFGMQAALNAVLGGDDYSNRAIRWDGFDLAIKGWGHIKSTNQGIGISKTHLETFKTHWTTGNNLVNASGKTDATYNSSFLMNGNASLTYSAANSSTFKLWTGMVLYTSSAAYGGTIFWKATPVFTIHGVNLNANYEKIKGRTNKPL